jgi:hypothetical protein
VANNGSASASILLNTTATNATTPTFASKVDFTAGIAPPLHHHRRHQRRRQNLT